MEMGKSEKKDNITSINSLILICRGKVLIGKIKFCTTWVLPMVSIRLEGGTYHLAWLGVSTILGLAVRRMPF